MTTHGSAQRYDSIQIDKIDSLSLSAGHTLADQRHFGSTARQKKCNIIAEKSSVSSNGSAKSFALYIFQKTQNVKILKETEIFKKS